MSATCQDAAILTLKNWIKVLGSNGDDNCTELAATVVTNIVAYNKAASHVHDLKKAAETLHLIAIVLDTKFGYKSTEFNDAFEAWSTMALAVDAATASELAAKELIDTSLDAWRIAIKKADVTTALQKEQ